MASHNRYTMRELATGTHQFPAPVEFPPRPGDMVRLREGGPVVEVLDVDYAKDGLAKRFRWLEINWDELPIVPPKEGAPAPAAAKAGDVYDGAKAGDARLARENLRLRKTMKDAVRELEKAQGLVISAKAWIEANL